MSSDDKVVASLMLFRAGKARRGREHCREGKPVAMQPSASDLVNVPRKGGTRGRRLIPWG